MRIIVATSGVPFSDGGASLLFDWLCLSLERAGHVVERLMLPFDSRPDHYLEQVLGWRAIDLRGRGDVLITIRTPSYVLRHERKIVWFIHHHRAAYDLWGTRWASIPDDPAGQALRQAIKRSDDVALREASALFVNSPVIGRRLKRFNALDSQLLYPPVIDPERFEARTYGDTIFYPSRLTSHKRQSLAIEAMRHTQTPVRLSIAGEADDATYSEELRALQAASPARDRIMLKVGWLPEDEKVAIFNDALAGVYIPYDEDSYGYPVLEAAAAGKASITVADAGGTAEFLSGADVGIVTESNPLALARAFDDLWRDRLRARQLGERARDRIAELKIDWSATVEKLLGVGTA